MKTISTQARLMSLVMAVATTVVVLGSTVVGMQSSAESQPLVVVHGEGDGQADRGAVSLEQPAEHRWRGAGSGLRRRRRRPPRHRSPPQHEQPGPRRAVCISYPRNAALATPRVPGIKTVLPQVNDEADRWPLMNCAACRQRAWVFRAGPRSIEWVIWSARTSTANWAARSTGSRRARPGATSCGRCWASSTPRMTRASSPPCRGASRASRAWRR